MGNLPAVALTDTRTLWREGHRHTQVLVLGTANPIQSAFALVSATVDRVDSWGHRIHGRCQQSRFSTDQRIAAALRGPMASRFWYTSMVTEGRECPS